MEVAALVPLFVALVLYALTLGLVQWTTRDSLSCNVQIRYTTLFVTTIALAMALLHLHEDMGASAHHIDLLCPPLWMLVGMGLSAASFTLGFFYQQGRLVHELACWATPASQTLRFSLVDLANRLRVRRLPGLHIVACEQPMALTVGILRPTIYLSTWMTRHLSAMELEGVLAHELAHIARADNLIALVSTVLLGATAFVPTSWSALKALLAERELATDALAVSVTGKPITLARGLLKAASPDTPNFNVAAGLLEISMIEQRVRHLVELHQASPTQIPRRSLEKGWLLALTLLAPLPLAWLIFALPHLLQLP